MRPSNPRVAPLVAYDPKSLPADTFISANESPYDMDPELKQKVLERLAALPFNRYPDPLAGKLRALIAQGYGLPGPDCVLLGNGGDELLMDLFLAYGGPERTLLNTPPTFSVNAYNALLTGTRVVDVPRKADFSLDEDAIMARAARGDIDLLVITSPNNPTGNVANVGFLRRLLESTDALVLVDEAYMEFADAGCSMTPYLGEYPNLLILRTFSKAYGLAGVRLGYVLGDPRVIRELGKVRQPYSVDSISQVLGEVVFADRTRYDARIRETRGERARLSAKLAALPRVRVFASQANFLLVRVPDAHAIWQDMYEQDSVLVRDFSATPGLEDCLRITVGSPQENDRFLQALCKQLDRRR
ncbi:MAG: histidinol-phosphate transaminase [Coriobacteriales bacterium]|nr:histidinol-phosphate transaminase [Coriobacteriales bacterium]